MIVRNARLILGGGIREDADLLVDGGNITTICDAGERRAESDEIDVAGNYVAPGFIDVHVHGALGRDTMEASADAFRVIVGYHTTGGTTSLLLTTATAPIAEITRALQAIRSAAAAIPQILGAHVEGPFISRDRAGAQRTEFIRELDGEAVDQLLDFRDVIRRVTLAPEIPGALELIETLHQHGIAVSGGHSDAWDEEARAAFEHGMRNATHTFNCMSSARRRGRERVAGLLEFALSEPEIMCELIADGHHVSATLMKMLYRAKRADGICLVTDATAGAGMAEGARFELAGKRCVVEDGVCLLEDRSSLAGSGSRMIDVVRTMVNVVGVPLHEAIAMATSNPARACGLQNKGVLKAGADADFVVVSPQLEVLQTFVQGERVYAADRAAATAR